MITLIYNFDTPEMSMHGGGETSIKAGSKKVLSSKRRSKSKSSVSLKTYNGQKTSLRKEGKGKSKSLVGPILLERTRMNFTRRKHGKKSGLLGNLVKKLSRNNSSLKFQKENSSARSMQNVDKANRDFIPKKSRRRKRCKRKRGVELDEASRLQRRARYQLIKLKLEQNLIDAYSGDGWKGQSREKIRPEEELQRAMTQILKCKLGIRDVVHQLELLSSVGCIEASVMSPDGSVSHEHIFCAKCKSQEVSLDNDIILCDGTCNCAFHQKCLDPPLATEHIPPGDQGWLCKFCDCKVDILEAMNAHLGTRFSLDSTWQEIFKEEAAIPVGGRVLQNTGDEWPSDDSEDDYDPDRNGNSCSCTGTGENASGDMSSFDNLSWSLEDEVFWGSGKELKVSSVDLLPNVDSDDVMDRGIINGRRQRQAVDYKKLYDEMFGKDDFTIGQVSEDEDWGPAKKKRKERESDAAGVLMTLYGSENKSPSLETIEIVKKHSEEPLIRKGFFRIPPGAVEKLRHVFAQNELPSRAVKEKLSRQLGLELEKVNKWFKNARYVALKIRKEHGEKHGHGADPNILNDSRSGNDATAAAVTINDDSTLGHSLKDLKKIHRGRNLGLFTSSPKKLSHDSPTIGNMAILEWSDDVCLKKQLKILKAKKKMKSRCIQEAEKEMERLCCLKSKLQRLKLLLPLSLEKKTCESVVLVPIAELREKV